MDAGELREQYKAGKRNFSGVEIVGGYFSDTIFVDIDFSNANLERACFDYTKLCRANFSNANLKDAEFKTAHLIDTDLSYANLTGADFTHADLIGANLTGANLTQADLSRAKLIGTNLTNANLTCFKIAEETIFHYTTTVDGNLIKDSTLALEREEFLRRYAMGQRNFEFAVLHRVDLSGVDLSGVNMFYARLSNCNLSKAILKGDWNSAKFINCDLRGANLNHCDFTNARFLSADLRKAKGYADLTCTSFIEVNFQDSQFDGHCQSPPLYYNVTLKDGFFLAGPNNYRQRPS